MYSNVLNIKEASQYLHISQSMLRKLIYKGEIRHMKIGYRYYLREIDLEEFLNKRLRGDEECI